MQRETSLLQSSLDGSDSQIIRANKSEEGFGADNHGITSKTTSLNQAVSFILDGSLYVLKSSGQVIRFQNGSEVGWTIGLRSTRHTSDGHLDGSR